MSSWPDGDDLHGGATAFSAGAPILVVPWGRDFVAELAAWLVREARQGGRDLGEFLLVFPHRRPARYLVEALKAEMDRTSPRVLPEILAVGQWLSRLRALGLDRPLRRAGPLDRARLLFDVVSELRQAGLGRLSALPEELRLFFPWGLRLDDLLEELLRHGRRPSNLLYVDDQVLPAASALLESLSDIYSLYLERLDALGWTTPGLDQAMAVGSPAASDQAEPFGDPSGLDAPLPDHAVAALAGRRLVLAGFHALTGVEESLFRRLWSEGRAAMVWRSDPALVHGGPCHFCAREHRALLRRWGAEAELPSGMVEAEEASGPKLRFYEGFDLHSQLAPLGDELRAAGNLAEAAVVIPDPAMLMPVLHGLPEETVGDVNVSMGFPMTRSAVYRLVEAILRCQESAPGAGLEAASDASLDAGPNAGPDALSDIGLDGDQADENGAAPDGADMDDEPDERFHWRDLVALVRHPYLKALRPDPSAPQSRPLRGALHGLEALLRQGEKFCDPLDLPLEELPDLSPERAALLRHVLEICLGRFGGLRSLADLAGALSDLVRLLCERGGDMWTRFPLDAECLHRLQTAIIPALRDSAMSQEELSRETLFGALRQLFRAERAPFEADPLGGLQVMGLLETRLLRFRTVYLLGATENLLPGTPAYDPLLPDPLRHLLGLPDSRHSDNVFAYNVHCLLHGAEEAVIFYQSGVQSGEMLDDKAVRSRFVEQLLFEMESREGRLIRPDPAPDSPLRPVGFPLRPIPRPRAGADLSDAARDRLLDRLKANALSASFLDGYLRCPYRFYLERLTAVRPLEEVEEDGDAAGFGELVHDLLRDLLAPWQGRVLDLAALAGRRDWLEEEFGKRLRADPAHAKLRLDQRIILERAGRLRLSAFLDSLPETRLVDLEREFETSLDVALPELREVRIQGRVDRIDERDGRLLVLDYKTGPGSRPDGSIWTDAALWESLDAWRPGLESPMPVLAERLRSVQLPLYLRLCAESLGRADNAGLVLLRDDGKERWLFDEDQEALAGTLVDDLGPRLVRFLVRHMLQAPRFEPRVSRACEWCPYASGCGQA